MSRTLARIQTDMAKRKTSAAASRTTKSAKSVLTPLYTLQVFLVGGPISEEYRGQVVSRKIQIRGDHTLHHLHQAIFKAYDRWEEHLYEFNVGDSPRDRSRLYPLGGGDGQLEGIEGSSGDPQKTTLDSLGLKNGQHFGYTFDFGEDWMHELEVSTIEEKPLRGRYPKIVDKVGASPPQYPDFEEEDDG